MPDIVPPQNHPKYGILTPVSGQTNRHWHTDCERLLTGGVCPLEAGIGQTEYCVDSCSGL